jgi:ATP-binding cassette, subfamily B, beta-glucan exporter
VFDQGRIIESGTFDELIARSGRFADLARAQFLTAEPTLRETEETPAAAE